MSTLLFLLIFKGKTMERKVISDQDSSFSQDEWLSDIFRIIHPSIQWDMPETIWKDEPMQ